MNFGEQIKKLRKQKNLTQEQMASQLGISRQAVSNWENDRNLPDIEMLISIAVTFQISLDDLILGGRDMNNMTEKLIKDGSENRRAKMNLISTCIGAGLLLGGYLGEITTLDRAYLFGACLTVVSAIYFRIKVGPHFEKNKLR